MLPEGEFILPFGECGFLVNGFNIPKKGLLPQIHRLKKNYTEKKKRKKEVHREGRGYKS